jgi:RND family efflux transporter MFP subunit
MKRLLAWLLLLLPLAAGGYALWRKLAGPIAVGVARVERGPAQATVFATGWIEPRERRLLRPPRPAIVERIYAKENEEVRAGSPLLRLRDSARDVKKERIRAELDQIAADLAPQSSLRTAAQARIDESKANEAWADSEVERGKPLQAQGLISQRDFDQLIAARDAASQRVRTLQDELSHTLADLETRRRQAAADFETLVAAERDDTLLAPFDGIVLARFAEEGEAVDAQRDLVKFGDVRDLFVEGDVDEEDVARVAVGQRVLVRISGDTTTLVPGQVGELFPDSNKATRSYRVRVIFPGAKFTAEGPLGLRGTTRAEGGRALLPGSSCELAIVVDERADTVVFPRAALTARRTVFVVDAGLAHERAIAVGLENFDRCEALSGLREGELVVIEGIADVRDGRRVNVHESTAVAGGEAAGAVRTAAMTLPPPPVKLAQLDGEPIDPLASRASAVVLLFTRSDCPISNKYAPEVNRLVATWSARDVEFFLVYVDPSETDDAVRTHRREYGYACKALLDRKHELVRRVGAQNTPEAAVYGKDRRLVYHGRIDDRFADLGVQRAQPTTHELEDALTAVLAGRAPAVAKAPSVGCRIDDLR